MFDLPDEHFVCEAYFRVLGRAPDPQGFLSYVAALRRRLSRPGLIRDLQRSPEWTGQLNIPQAGALHCAPDLWPLAWRRFQGSPLARSRRDLLQIEGELFAHASYWLLFGREPSATELQAWRQIADDRDSRSRWLAGLERQAGFRPMRWWRRQRQNFEMPRIERTPPLAQTGLHKSLTVPADISGAAFFTIATRSYLPFVRVLMQSLRRHHPAQHLFVLLVDGEGTECEGDPWVTVPAAALDLPQFQDMCVRYDVTELSTALKPWFMCWLFDRTDVQELTYLDPDIQVHQPLAAAFELLRSGASIVLTPHALHALDDGGEPDDHTILKSGAFNLGFVAVRRAPDSMAFVRWWAERLKTGSLVQFQDNLFTDQRWCDLAPALVPGLAILRDCTFNVAYWNLPHRRVERTSEGTWLVNGSPLTFFHFSGFDPEDPDKLSRYQNRKLLEGGSALGMLLSDYADQVLRSGWRAAQDEGYGLAHIQGVQLSPTLRALFRAIKPAGSCWTRQQALEALTMEAGDSRTLPTLARRLHASRADLRAVFDLNSPASRLAFEAWFWSTGVVEHGLVSLMRHAHTTKTGKV
jgi:hypothetical protein